ncbi:MAG: NAD-dependent epimerase/dehydratase family protein [Janthinobacterium lividum]
MAQAPLPSSDLQDVLEQTRPLWDEMRGARLFITGGSGFFGCWLLESFLHANETLGLNARATVLSRDPDGFARRSPHITNHPAISLCKGEMRTFVYPEGQFRYVIHAATDVARVASSADPFERLDAIQQGTAHTLRFAGSHGTEKFLLVSSGSAYGAQPQEMSHVPETYLGAPETWQTASSYGEGKRVSELMCALYAVHKRMEFKLARCFAFAGPGLALDANFAIGNFIGDILAGRDVSIAGDGTPLRSYLYASDLATWLWTMLFRAPTLEVFNVGSEDAISIADLAKRLIATLGSPASLHIAQQAKLGAALQQYVPSTEKAWRDLQLRQTVSLDEAIRRMAAWHKASNG